MFWPLWRRKKTKQLERMDFMLQALLKDVSEMRLEVRSTYKRTKRLEEALTVGQDSNSEEG